MLYAAGVNVYGVRLDGHATAPANLSSVRWESWIDSILRGVGVMRHHCDRLVIGGFSLGGLLSLHVASTGRADLAGVFSINAPMRLHDRRAMLAPMVVRLDGWRRVAGLGRAPLRRSNAHSESPDINYAEDYIAGLAQAVEVMRVCRKRLADITAPALIVQATGDPVVVRESGQVIHDRIGSQEKTLVELDFDRHIVVRGDGVEAVGRHVLDFVASEPVGGPGLVLRDRAERGRRREKDTPKERKRVRLGFARWR
jgi:esterase/lipase